MIRFPFLRPNARVLTSALRAHTVIPIEDMLSHLLRIDAELEMCDADRTAETAGHIDRTVRLTNREQAPAAKAAH